VALPGVAVAVLNEEAARAAELIGLLGNDPDRELLTGQVSAGQLHRLGGVDLIHRPDRASLPTTPTNGPGLSINSSRTVDRGAS